MSDDIDDGIVRAAMAFSTWPEPSEAVKEEFCTLPRAPLAALIDEYLDGRKDQKLESSLRAIAQLNEGDLSDLDDPKFKSFIVAMTSVSHDAIGDCALRLRAFRIGVRNTLQSRYAAREDE